MKVGREFRTMVIKEGGERVTNVTRIITKLNDDSTVGYSHTNGNHLLRSELNPGH